MLYERGSWTLVRYAGPASKALIGSKPIGSELASHMVSYPLQVNKKLTGCTRAPGPFVPYMPLARPATVSVA